MFTLRRIAFKLFRASKTNVVSCISIIMISICLIMTMCVYIFNANAQLKNEIQALYGDAEMTVGYNPDQHKWLSKKHIEQIKQIDGIKHVSSVSLTHSLVEKKLNSVYTLGVENTGLVKSRYHFKENLNNREIIISQSLAKLLNKNIGSTIQVNNEKFKIKEILKPINGIEEKYLILLSNDIVKKWMGNNDDIIGLFALVDTNDRMKASTIASNIKLVDNSLRIDITDEYDFVKENLQSLMIFIIVLSFFIILITGFLLLSIFQLLFYKTKAQLMILRTLGASAKQIGRLVHVQLFVINGIGVILGIILSFLIVKFGLPTIINQLSLPKSNFNFPASLVLIISTSCFIILQLFTNAQVRKSMKLLPSQITNENEDHSVKWNKWKVSFVITIAALAISTTIYGTMIDDGTGKSAVYILIGTLLSCLLFLHLLPSVFSIVIRICLKPIRIVFGNEAFLACQQLMPQVRRNTPIILSIIALLTILIFGSSLLKALQNNNDQFISRYYETSLVLKNVLDDKTLSQKDVERIEKLPAVSFAYATSFDSMGMYIEGKWESVGFATTDIKQYVAMKKISPIKGSLSNGVLVSKNFAKQHKLKVGEKIEIGSYLGNSITERKKTPIIAIIPNLIDGNDVYVDWSMPLYAGEEPIINKIMIETTNVNEALNQLEDLKQSFPELQIINKETLLKQSKEMFYQRWSLFIGVFMILITATCLGILQTLMNSIYSKRGDYAIQRLLGLTPNQLINLILTQVMTFILYGLVLGSFVGIVLTKMYSLIDRNSNLTIDFITLGSVSLTFFLLTILVISIQGYRISRKNLVDEIINL